MALKQYKPYTKSTRSTILIDKSDLWKGKPYKPLTTQNKPAKGRNNMGRITSRNHGGGHKQKYRLIAFQSKYLDSKNYQFENVLSLNSLLKKYLPF